MALNTDPASFFANLNKPTTTVANAGGDVASSFFSSLPKPTQPVTQKKTTVVEPVKKNVFGDITTFIKQSPYQVFKEQLVGGTKTLPGMAKTVAGIILKNFVDVQEKQQKIVAPLKAVLSIKQGYEVDKQLSKKTQDIATSLREQGVASQKKAIDEYTKNVTPSKGIKGLLEQVAFNLPQVVASTGLSLATGIITKNPTLAGYLGATISYGMGASEVYNEARNQGVSDAKALSLSTIGGIIIGALDFAPLSKLLRKTGTVETVKKSIVKKIAQGLTGAVVQSGFEGITEATQEIIGNAITLTYKEQKDLFKFAKETGEEAIQAGLVGAILGGVTSGTLDTITGITNKGKIEEKVKTALETPKEERTDEENAIVEALFTKELTPDEAISYVVENDLGKTEEGKTIMLASVKAKQENKIIRISPSTDEKSLEITVTDPTPLPSSAERLREPPVASEEENKPIVEESRGVPSTGGEINPLIQEANKYKSGKEFYLRMNDATRDSFRSKGIRGEEALTEFWNKNAIKTEPILTDLNPTGSLYADYNPQSRMTMKLGKNITTYDKTAGLKPDEMVTIYRGASKNHKTINPGDFITTKREVAEAYTGDKNVIEMKVKAKDILDDITEPLGDEYIYRPVSGGEIGGVGKEEISKNSDKEPQQTSQTRRVLSTKETQVIQERIKDGLERIRVVSDSPSKMIEEITKLHDEIISLAKNDKVVLSALRTALNKEMYTLAGKTGDYKQDYKNLQEMMKDPDIGPIRSKLEDYVKEIDTKLITAKEPMNETRTVVSKETPTGTGKTKNSRLFERIKDTLTSEYDQKEVKYNELSLNSQAEKVVDLIESDPEKAVRIAKGFEEAPAGMTQNAVSVALAETARAQGDYKTAAELWIKTSLRSTRLGQEIASLRGSFSINEPLNAVKKLLDSRMELVGRRYKDIIKGLSLKEGATTMEKVDALVKHEAKKVKKQLAETQNRIAKAQEIINALKCK
mgnify:CR=1 FL=1